MPEDRKFRILSIDGGEIGKFIVVMIQRNGQDINCTSI